MAGWSVIKGKLNCVSFSIKSDQLNLLEFDSEKVVFFF